jgi:plasmid replication initiation protein
MEKQTKKTDSKKEIVVQHNRLIEARYGLSLQEKRIILWLISKIKPDDKEFKNYEICIKEFSHILELQLDNQYTKLRLTLKRLMTRVLEIYNEETGGWILFNWLSSAEYIPKQGKLFLCFDPKLKPYLLQLKSEFTKLNISDLINFKSIYSIRIFELLCQYESIGKRKVKIKELRESCGINTNEYQKYSHLKDKVINRATTEINAKTEYDVGFREIKESRRVAEIEFTIKKRTHFEKHQLEKAVIIQRELRSQNILVEQIKEYGFSRITAKKFLQQNPEEIVRDALKSVNIQIERGNVKNPKAMLRTAIQECWKPDVYSTRKKSG